METLNACPPEVIRRFFNWSWRFIVTIAPTPPPEWDMNDNVKRLVNRARTLSKLRSNGEEDYEEEWANIGRIVSAEAFEFGLHAGEEPQEGSRD